MIYKTLKTSFINDEWDFDHYNAVHKSKSVSLWIGNSWVFFTSEDPKFGIPFYMRPFLYYHCKQAMRRDALKMLSDKEPGDAI
jgi:hypothetical protein